MKKSRCHHCMVAVGNSLFSLGGTDVVSVHSKSQFRSNKSVQLSSIEEYSISGQRWKFTCDLVHPVHRATAAVSGERILIIGGIGNDHMPRNWVQCFHTRLKESSVISNLPFMSFSLIATTIRDSVFVTCLDADGSVAVRLTPDFGFTSVEFDIPSELEILGISHHDGQFLVLTVSSESPGCLGNIMKINLKTSKTEVLEMKGNSAPKLIFGTHRCNIDKKYLYHTYFQ